MVAGLAPRSEGGSGPGYHRTSPYRYRASVKIRVVARAAGDRRATVSAPPGLRRSRAHRPRISRTQPQVWGGRVRSDARVENKPNRFSRNEQESHLHGATTSAGSFGTNRSHFLRTLGAQRPSLRGLLCDLCESLAGEKDLGFMLHNIELDRNQRTKAVKIAHALQTAVKIFLTGASAKIPPLSHLENGRGLLQTSHPEFALRVSRAALGTRLDRTTDPARHCGPSHRGLHHPDPEGEEKEGRSQAGGNDPRRGEGALFGGAAIYRFDDQPPKPIGSPGSTTANASVAGPSPSSPTSGRSRTTSRPRSPENSKLC